MGWYDCFAFWPSGVELAAAPFFFLRRAFFTFSPSSATAADSASCFSCSCAASIAIVYFFLFID
jgi:hypothetical protein